MNYKYGIIKMMSIMILMNENDILLIIICSHNLGHTLIKSIINII